MKFPSAFIPFLGAACLLATSATGLSGDHKITVYRDRDHDGHYNKQTIRVPDHHGHHSGGYYYRRPYPYYSGPSFGVTINRSYSPSYSSYSGDLAADVQHQLRRRGYYRGSIDGDVGPGTRGAIRAYQYDRGLPVTGRIDRSLLRSLGIG